MADHADDDLPAPHILPGARSSAPAIRLDQPALTSAGGPPAPDVPMWDAAAREAIVQFLDGTWRLCRVIDWRQRADKAWVCDLRWGVSGRLYQGRYIYDPARVRQVGSLRRTWPRVRARSSAGPAPVRRASRNDDPGGPLDHQLREHAPGVAWPLVLELIGGMRPAAGRSRRSTRPSSRGGPMR